ncbi:MAG: site-2 protease family protein [Clostridia bacterium]
MKKIRIHPLLILMAIILIAFGLGKVVFSAFIALVVHEVGHTIAAKKLGLEIKSLFLLPFGASLNLKKSTLSIREEIVIAIMGPIFSLASIIVCVAFWWIFPVTYIFTKDFVWAGVSLFLINLLPAFPLDGGRVLWAIISNNYLEKNARKIVVWSNLFFSALFFVLFATSFLTSINITFAFMSFFLVQGIFENKWSSEYSKLLYKYDSRRQKGNVVGVKTISVSPETTILKILQNMSKTKVNQVLVCMPNGKMKAMFDTQFESICEKYPLDYTIKEVFKIK